MMKLFTAATPRKVIVASTLAALLIGLTLFLFETLESVGGHGITIASFGATALIIVFAPKNPGSSPGAVFFGYMTAGLVALVLSGIPNMPYWLMTAIAVGIVSALQIATNLVHPPAVAYSLSYFYGGYGFSEFLLTAPALLSFFIALGVLSFVLEIATSLIWKDQHHRTAAPRTFAGRVDALIPYALVILFVSIVIEFAYVDIALRYSTLFTILNGLILTLFVVDLYCKYQAVRDLRRFLLKNWLDVLATLPVFFVLRFLEGIFMLVRMQQFFITGGTQFTSITRLLKPIARFPRFAKLIEQIENR